MTPRLEIRLDAEPSDGSWAAMLARVRPDRRVRLSIAAPADCVPSATLRRARDAGFVRVRWDVTGTGPAPGAVDSAVAVGANELELDAFDSPWDRIREHRRTGALAHVCLKTTASRPPVVNPCEADEVRIDAAGTEVGVVDRVLASVGDRFPRVAVVGMPLCALSRLDPRRVLANVLVARPCDRPPTGLVLPFEEPSRAYFGPCGACSLALACDGGDAAADAFEPRPLCIRAFPDGPAADVTAGPGFVTARRHPAGFLTGKVHVLGVLAGIRPCGRLALPPDATRRALARLSRLGLRTALVPAAQAPGDRDTARDPVGAVAHVFFSRDGSASRAADLERRFSKAEASGAPMGTDTFSRAMGRLLGYPECCVEAFVKAGPGTATDDLIRAAHRRSERFHWVLNHLDARSTFPLVAHVPCRYDCEASVAQARGVLGMLDSLYPFLGETARRVLARPVLHAGGARIVAFDGDVDPDGSGLSYRSIDPLGRRGVSPADPDPEWSAILAVLGTANRLRRADGGVRLGRSGAEDTLLPIVPAPCLFPFGSDPEEGSCQCTGAGTRTDGVSPGRPTAG